jgi:hypothetical protein
VIQAERLVPNLTVTVASAVAEHATVLGLEVFMGHDWIVILADDDGYQRG